MPGDVIVVVLFIIVFGCAAFFSGVVYLIGCVLAGAARCFTRFLRGPHEMPPQPVKAKLVVGMICTRPQCRRVEYRKGARYCGQCGAELGPVD